MSLLRIINPNPNLLFRHRNPNPNPPFFLPPISASSKNPPKSNPNPNPNPNPKKNPPRRHKPNQSPEPASATDPFPSTIPRKPRRGRRSEAAAVEDFVRDSLERTFASIREQSTEVMDGKEEVNVLKPEMEVEEVDREEEEEEEMVVEEEDADWPADANVGWGVRASEYFERHPIRNVVEDGVEIDWEGEVEDGWVKEINCLEWESFAFHPSPLIVLVFERYNRDRVFVNFLAFGVKLNC